MEHVFCRWCACRILTDGKATDALFAAWLAEFCSPHHQQLFAKETVAESRAWWQKDLGASKR
jgi:hypothetical protein